MKKFKVFIIISNIIFITYEAFGVRSISSIPVSLFSAAGAVVCKKPWGETDPSKCEEIAYCVTADVKGIEVIESGVRAITHAYALNLNNLSNITQSLTIKIENISLNYNVSSKTKDFNVPSTPVSVTPFKTFEKKLSLNALESKIFTIFLACNNGNKCDLFNSIDDPSVDLSTKYSGANPYVCQQMLSQIRFHISVAEPKGAIQAVITNAGHRHSGISDHFFNSPATIPINGGNSF